MQEMNFVTTLSNFLRAVLILMLFVNDLSFRDLKLPEVLTKSLEKTKISPNLAGDAKDERIKSFDICPLFFISSAFL